TTLPVLPVAPVTMILGLVMFVSFEDSLQKCNGVVWYRMVPIGDSMVLFGTNVKGGGFMTTRWMLRRGLDDRDETAVRGRILEAAFAAFTNNGYAATSTLEIATRARVSKRDLYALVGNKQEMLMACITERAKRFRVPADLPVPHDRESLAHLLASF